MRRLLFLGLVGLCLALTGAQCVGLFDQGDGTRVAALRGFSSAEELRKYLVSEAQKSLSPQDGGWRGGWDGWFGLAPLAGAPGADWAADAAEGGQATGGQADPGYSTTNIQETGVDESDVVKNDAGTIYVLEGKTIHIVQATPPEGVAELSTVTLETEGDSLYLKGDKLIALGRRSVYYTGGGGGGDIVFAAAQAGDSGSDDVLGGPWSDGSETSVTIIDVSDPANPVVEATLKFEGNLVSSRLIASSLHLILTTLPALPDNPTPLALSGMTLDDWLPDFTLEAGGAVVDSGNIGDWPVFFYPGEPNGYGITTVVTLNVDDPTAEFESTAVTANAGTIYASSAALYISDTENSFDNFEARTDTIIHKLAFTESGTGYVASGLVPGRPLNQYSLGEHEGHLRIATTLSDFGDLSNSVYVLKENGTNLEVVGRVEDIAPGEQIYAARFIGPRGFLVTFRRVDPLFTMDLSDPANPRVVGQLKVPGYSDHIQLLDENHLLTIGKDAEDAGPWAWIQGVQLSVFDVTDMTNPSLLHKEIIGGRGTDSEANRNPKAFNYYAPLNALAFPIDVYGSDTTGAELGGYEFTGLYVYRVTVENGFEFLGRISTVDGTTQGRCYYWNFGNAFARGVFIGNAVYAATENGVQSASMDDVSTVVGQVDFADTTPSETCFWDVPVLVLPEGEGVQ